LWYNKLIEEHTHHDWQLNEAERPTLDQLFNDAWWWVHDKNVSPAGNYISLNVWFGKLGESISSPPFNAHKIMDEIGTCMVGLIALAQSLNVNPKGCLDMAMKARDFPEIPKTYKTMNPILPKPNEEPEWMKNLRRKLEARFVGLFLYYPNEQCWVRLEQVEIDFRDSSEGRKMDRVKDYYGNMWFVSDLIEAEKNQQVKAYNQCPSDKLVY